MLGFPWCLFVVLSVRRSNNTKKGGGRGGGGVGIGTLGRVYNKKICGEGE